MQITGNQNGFSFFSAYKVGAAQKNQSSAATEKMDQGTEAEATPVRPTDESGDPHREGLLLEAAHRSAARTAEWTEALATF